ncbi:hypothetical protein APHAL10511_006671 [Amanita phalloides]|nr:hypothetical protein APHAL10511_006671 [Amanita phalloides]
MSSSEQSNKAAAASQEHVYPPPVVAFTPQAFNGATYASPPPPGAYPPPFFAYPPPPDGNHGENGQNGVPPPGPPYMMAFPPPPPGMVYAFPPPQGQVPPGAPVPTPPALTKPKRKQVKMACTNCAAACKRCDEGRPCERCMKYGISDTCRDGQRKERKKGIKRGPYKRKGKNGDTEWVPTTQAAVTNPSPMHSVGPYSPPECYYGPVYYPTPGAFLPHPPHEVPPGQEGTANGNPPIMPYFLPAYPPPSSHLNLSSRKSCNLNKPFSKYPIALSRLRPLQKDRLRKRKKTKKVQRRMPHLHLELELERRGLRRKGLVVQRVVSQGQRRPRRLVRRRTRRMEDKAMGARRRGPPRFIHLVTFFLLSHCFLS